MEDDDEFGDLYTDVLQPFASSSSSSAPPPTLPSAAPQSLHRPIDLNLKNDDEDAIYGARSSNHVVPGKPSNQTLAPPGPAPFAAAADSVPQSLIPAGDVAPGLDDVKLRERGFEDSNFVIGSGGDGGQGENLMEKEVNFDIDEGNLGDEDVGSEPVIPGLSSGPVRQAAGDIENLEASGRDGGDVGDDGAGDDWDSDSEDDLQIVLNDNNHGPLAMERGEMEDDEDEGLVIVADGDPNQATEEQDWGEDAGQAADGERKEMVEAGKAGSGGPVPMKIGYSSHGYHPFHSQFKYVRPGAAPMVGATTSGPGGVPGQVRPPLNMGLMAGRGRGDWRPLGMKNTTMQKSFHPGFGPGWGNNTAGRGFGGGLEFTLPSHKTIFDVDIDGFEEKPWKYPGVDTSDFFNFGFNEESWKDYCKQLEQLRLESTMQSKIRVYESGRAEQEYDPDLPPELAAAAGIHDVPSETANPGKSDVGQGDISKGSARLRPPIPTGRAIQVESCFGERLPSIDTRPPRIRDSDAVIEIVLQDSMDDDASAENGVPDRPDNDPPQGDFGGREAEEDAAQVDSEYFDNYPQAFNGRKREPVGTRMPFPNSVHDGIPGRNLPFPPDQPVRNAGSGAQIPVYPGGDFSAEYEERQRQGKARDRSPQMTPSQRDKNYSDNEPEDSGESMDSRRSPLLSSPVLRDVHESSVEHRDANEDEAALADGSPGMGKDETTSNTTGMDALEDGASKKQKPGSQGEQSVIHEPDDGEDSKAARSSDNSRARSGSSREYRRDVVDEEVIQGRSTRMGSVKRHFDEKEHGVQRRNRDGRQEVERNRIVVKGREDSYPYRDFDPSSSHHLHARPDGFDRRKERENLDGPWPRRDDDSSSRRIRTEETRKRERSAEIGSRHRSKVREIDRSDKDELIHSRKQMDNGGYRVYYDKDLGPRHRERDDNLKGRYEHMDDYHVKRKRDDELLKRDHMDKEEILHGHRENTGRRKRERDEVLDLRKRDEQQRLRDNHDDYHSVRNKDDSWSQRERVEKPREREEWQRLKQPHEENISKREREEGRAVTRGGRSAEDKGWVGHPKAKDENKGSDKDYQHKETVRHSEPSKRRDRTEDGSSHHGGREDVYTRSNQMSNGERRSRQERPNIRNDRAVSASDEHKVHDRKHKENTRRNKESDSGDNSTFSSKRNQEDHGGHSHETGSKGTTEQGVKEHGIPAQHHHSRKQKEDGGSSDDEQQASRRGRSKLERWTSHKERDFNIKSKSSSTLKHKEINRNDSGSLEGSKKLPDEPSKPVETLDIQHLAEEKDAADPEAKEGETTRHLDTVEKLKKRSERFKLPMPIEKDASTVKKMESEALASTKGGSPVDSEIKPERPARKRRWISN